MINTTVLAETPLKRKRSDNNNQEEPKYILDREQVEKFRIDALIGLERDQEKNELKRRELDVLERFSLDHHYTINSVDNQKTIDQIEEKKISKIVKEIFAKNEVIKLMVGGKLFITTLTTINKRENMLKTMLSSGVGIDRESEHGAIVLDLNPDYFPILLEHLRTGSTNYVGLWEEVSETTLIHLRNLLKDSDFFGTNKLSARIIQLITEYQNKLQQLEKDPVKKNDELINNLCSNQDEQDEKWITKFANITLQEKKILEEFVEQKREELNREEELLKEKESKLQKVSITFNVRGTKFTISLEKLLVHRDSIFPSILSELKDDYQNEIFIDRDSTIFQYIFEYLQHGTTHTIPKDDSKRKLIYKEAKEFKLFSLVDFLDPLRFPVEDIGPKNLKIKQEEDFLRRMFVSERQNPILNDPYLHMINVFGTENISRNIFQPTEPNVPLLFDFENPVDSSELVNEFSGLQIPLVPTICKSREIFFHQFSIFSGHLFKDMDWSNVFAAGGGILACLLEIPVGTFPNTPPPKERIYWDNDDCESSDSETDPETNDESDYFTASSDEEFPLGPTSNTPRGDTYTGIRRLPFKYEYSTTERYFRTSPQWRNSDIDLFLYALNEKQAEEKIIYLYNLFKQNLNNGDIVITRTQHAVTFIFNGLPSVQVITRLYKSPAEVLMGFDVPCCCVGFDGNQVYCLPRAAVAISTRCNLVDVDRQSTTFELRLIKYALRGFRIGVPGYDEKKLANSMVYDRNSLYFPYRFSTKSKKIADIKKVTGLARILLTIHGYKNNRRRYAVFKSIGGTNNLEKTINMLEPSEDHDYRQVPIKQNSATKYFQVLETIADHQKYKGRKSYFEYSMNDIQHIINTENPISNLTPNIEWITINPTSQSIGSFHPHTRNFFVDAYSNPKHLNKLKCKYEWSYKKKWSHGKFTNFNEETSNTLERKYREFLRSGKLMVNSKHSGINEHSINFASMTMSRDIPTDYPFSDYYTIIRARIAEKIIKRKKILNENYILEEKNERKENEEMDDDIFFSSLE